MNTIKPALPKDFVQSQLGVSEQVFRRWTRAAQVGTKPFYEDWEVALILEVKKCLEQYRSLKRAAEHIDNLLGV
jgi:hypothetical protein